MRERTLEQNKERVERVERERTYWNKLKREVEREGE